MTNRLVLNTIRFTMKELFVDLKDYLSENTVFNRKAARGIIIKNNKLLCIHSKYGDYKFPGGGLENNETLEQTLFREVLEETGYSVKEKSLKSAFIVHEKRRGEDSDIMLMDSFYFFCDVYENPGEQSLVDYENDYQYKVAWLSIDEMISHNESCKNLENIPWIVREIVVLKELKKILTFDNK